MDEKNNKISLNDNEMKVYSRTLQFIFIKAALDIFPNCKIIIEHSISKGLFGELLKNTSLNQEDISKIKVRMAEIINQDIPINKIKVTKEEAIKIFRNYGMNDKVLLLEHVDFEKVSLYELDGRYDYFYGSMLKTTGEIKAYDLMLYEDGFILRQPNKENILKLEPYKEQKKLFNIFVETEKWLNILDIGNVGVLNDKILNGEVSDLIMISEALQEKKIAYISDMISNKEEVKVVLISGPSSSGKTTFTNRLAIQLKVNGLSPLSISLDDYFVNRDKTPLDADGNFDFESIYALDLELFNKDLALLLDGEEVELPSFNFKKGTREWIGNKVKLPSKGVILIEGIHGLNPMLTSAIDEVNKFKIYISALTQLNLDNHNRIATTDIRRVRRIVRDSLSRGYGAETTLKMWPSVRKGEKKNIFVYQEEADVMFNSTLVYEMSVLKKYALKELDKIEKDSLVYEEANRLKAFLGFFRDIDEEWVPFNSIIREFIGGSIFYKY